MRASIKPLDLEEFLAWERAQEQKFEFDGIQPVAMTGGSILHSRVITRLILAIGPRLRAPCEVFQSDLKVLTARDTRVRYPDVTIACGGTDETKDTIAPVVVFEVMSPSSVLTDSRIKPLEYQQTPSIVVYVLLAADQPEVQVMRRSNAWQVEAVAGQIDLPEVGIAVPLDALYF